MDRFPDWGARFRSSLLLQFQKRFYLPVPFGVDFDGISPGSMEQRRERKLVQISIWTLGFYRDVVWRPILFGGCAGNSPAV